MTIAALVGSGIAADRDPDCVASFLDEVSRPPTWSCDHIHKGQTAFRTMCQPGGLLCSSCMAVSTFDDACIGCECCGGQIDNPLTSLYRLDLRTVHGVPIASVSQLCSLCGALSAAPPLRVRGL